MAAQTQTSSFASKIGNRLDAAIKQHAKDETNYGFTQLPAGIKNGTARLLRCYFAQHPAGHKKAGEWYLRMEATVVAPEMHQLPDGREMKVSGLTSSQIFPCYDTTSGDGKVTPAGENLARIMNEFRKLGADTSTFGSAAHLEATAKALTNAKPYFRFSTSLREGRIDPKTGKKGEDGVWENWNGIKGVEDFAAHAKNGQASGVSGAATAAPAAAVKPQASTKPSANGPSPASPKAAPAKAGKPAAKAPAPAPEPEPAEPEPTQEEAAAASDEAGETDINDQDIPTLLALANDNNGAAQRKLMDIATSVGVDEETAKAAQTWDDLVALIEEVAPSGDGSGEPSEEGSDEGGSEEQQADEEPFLPKIAEIYGYHPIDPKTKKASAKKVEVVIIAVDEDARTVNLKNNENKKTIYKDVSFDDLVSAD